MFRRRHICTTSYAYAILQELLPNSHHLFFFGQLWIKCVVSFSNITIATLGAVKNLFAICFVDALLREIRAEGLPNDGRLVSTKAAGKFASFS